MKIVVFLGPSLPLEQAKSILPQADFYPPAGCGDVIKVLRSQPDCILLIDGVFEQRGAVWHKELCFARSQGVVVYGASSMGALRAAEMPGEPGLIGYGTVFTRYHDQITMDDDDVALVHHADTSTPNTPMVNVDATLEVALQHQAITKEAADDIRASLKAQPYFQRDLLAHTQAGNSYHQVMLAHYQDQKGLDAAGLLQHVASLASLPNLPMPEMINTTFFCQLYRRMIVAPYPYSHTPAEQLYWRACEDNGDSLPRLGRLMHLIYDIMPKAFEATADGMKQWLAQQPEHKNLIPLLRLYHANTMPPEAILSCMARLYGVLLNWMQSHNLVCSETASQTFADAFRQNHGLEEVEDTLAWFTEHNLDEDGFVELIITTSAMYHIVDLGYSHYLGISTSTDLTPWGEIAYETIRKII